MRERPSPALRLSYPLAVKLERLRHRVDKRLAELFAGAEEATPLAQAMRDAVLGGGKRLRPVFLLLVFDVLARRGRLPVDVACAVEILHTASLILDDLPCMDDAAVRRGRPTLHRQWGEAIAILAAFGLLARAFAVLRGGLVDAGVAPAHREALADRLAEVVRTMCQGQVLDLGEGGIVDSLTQLEAIHAQKTGALFAFTAELGAACAGVWGEVREALLVYARNLGLAFQVKDDLLDAAGAQAVTGKPVGRDVALGRTTFVSVFGDEGAQELCDDLIAAAQQALSPLGEGARPLREFADYVRQRSA